MSKAIEDVIAERKRQIEAEGWTPEHDDEHEEGELAMAAISYCFSSRYERGHAEKFFPDTWHHDWLKPTTPRRDLVKAAALIIAEIERLDRNDHDH